MLLLPYTIHLIYYCTQDEVTSLPRSICYACCNIVNVNLPLWSMAVRCSWALHIGWHPSRQIYFVTSIKQYVKKNIHISVFHLPHWICHLVAPAFSEIWQCVSLRVDPRLRQSVCRWPRPKSNRGCQRSCRTRGLSSEFSPAVTHWILIATNLLSPKGWAVWSTGAQRSRVKPEWLDCESYALHLINCCFTHYT